MIPLIGNVGNIGVQMRTTQVAQPTTNGEGTSTSSSSVRMNGSASDGRTETEEHLTLLQQMGESVRTMQDLVSRMSTLLPFPNPPSSTAFESTQHSPPNPPHPSTSQVESASPNRHISTPETLPALHIKKRRSFSPVERTDENEHPHSSRVRRLSSSEDELSPEELADIRAPWVEMTIEDSLPLHEVPRQGSPPRVRSPSRSPSRSLLRRGSLLKHDITNEIASTENDGQINHNNKLDKGKGREVFVEDGSEDE